MGQIFLMFGGQQKLKHILRGLAINPRFFRWLIAGSEAFLNPQMSDAAFYLL
jgi:hypothetical protein